jgi:spectinomycin phosphotransferase
VINIEPSSAKQELEGLLRSAYGMAVDTLEFLVSGSEAYAYVARVGPTRYFVKLHDPDGIQELDFTLRLADVLYREGGIAGVVPPIAALDGRLRTALAPYPITVHPFVQGQSAGVRGPLTESDAIHVGMLVGRFHRCSAALQLMGRNTLTERFDTGCIQVLDALLATTARPDGMRGHVFDLLARNRDGVYEAMATLQRVRDQARAVPYRPAITHGDLTLSNLMAGEDGRFYVVDWNSALVAPAEKDLVFFGGATFEPFLYGYTGGTKLEPVSHDRLLFFIYRWSLDGIAFFATRLLTEDATSVRNDDDLAVLHSFLPFDSKRIATDIASMEQTIRKFSAPR